MIWIVINHDSNHIHSKTHSCSSEPWNIDYITLGESSPFMAEQFRLVNYCNFPRYEHPQKWIKGLDEGSGSFADYLVTSVHLKGSPENVLFPESILKRIPGNATRDGWRIRRSCVLTGWLSFADEHNSTDFQNAHNHVSFEKTIWKKKREFLRWVHTIETGT